MEPPSAPRSGRSAVAPQQPAPAPPLSPLPRHRRPAPPGRAPLAAARSSLGCPELSAFGGSTRSPETLRVPGRSGVPERRRLSADGRGWDSGLAARPHRGRRAGRWTRSERKKPAR